MTFNEIYKNFQNTGAVTEERQATSGENLMRLLRDFFEAFDRIFVKGE
jgi:hypothetical protein